MPIALFLLADGFEELEFVAPYDILHRGGVEVKTASISDKLEVVGAHGLKVLADMLLQAVEGLPFDLLVLPGGGPGTENLLASNAVKNLVIKSNEAGKQIAAICAAPKVLASAGILGNHIVTSYPSVRAEIEPCCESYSANTAVVMSKNIITAEGAGAAAEFGFCLLSALGMPEKAEKVYEQMRF